MSNKKKQQAKPKPKQEQPTTNPIFNFEDTGLKKTGLFLLAVLLITFVVYLPSLENGFTNWDDNVYVPENKLITSLSGDNIKKIFDPEHHVSLNYHPITILSLAVDYSISGFNPKVFHRSNLLFHLLNTGLVFWLVLLLSDKKLLAATIAALLFGIHPMHVESVAWIAERKDVLYVFFFLSALLVYLKYLKEQKFILYAGVLILFLLSVLSKAMGIVLPLILFLLDYYKGRSFDKKLIIEKLPFLALSVYFGLLAVDIQSNGALASFAVFTVAQRIAFASYGIVMYIYKLFVPIHLSCFYPYPNLEDGHLPIIFYIAPVIVISLLGALVYLFKKNKTFVFGICFYLVAVAMVLQFISVGKAIIADRYTYLSYIGLFFPLAIGFQWLQSNPNDKWRVYKLPATVLLLSMLVFYGYQTMERIKVWSNSETLWSDAIEKYPNCEAAYANRGSYLINKNAYDINIKSNQELEYDRALADFNMAIALDNNNPKVFTNRANIYGLKNQFDLSLKDYSKSIALDSSDAEVYANRGVTFSIMKQYDKAIADYNKALAIKPGMLVVRENKAYAFVVSGQYDKGLSDLDALIQQNPAKAEYYLYRGVAYFNEGKMKEAIVDNSKVIELDPNNAQAYFNRSATYKEMGDFKKAFEDLQKAQSLGYLVDAAYMNDLKVRAQ